MNSHVERAPAPAPLCVGFIHPDLGVGGAERLIVDAAVHLRDAGHRVILFTAHHDWSRCFDETRDGRLDVRAHGTFLPMHVGRRLRAPCAIFRMAYLAVAMARSGERFDVIFCDVVAHIVPLLRRLTHAPVVFYCHFPDQLLAPRRGLLYRCYRAPINQLEAAGMARADRVLVNSHFTASAFRASFPTAGASHLEVVYPGVDCSRYACTPPPPPARRTTIASIGRHERDKNLGLAVEALALLRERLSPAEFDDVELILAGSYNPSVPAQREVRAALQTRALELGLGAHVAFLGDVTEAERLQLLAASRCVVHTADAEHFGFVPVEAMAAGRPVVAVDAGGVRETVRHEETGLLCRPTPGAFAAALTRLIRDRDAAERMGRCGRERAETHFSRAAFGTRLERILREVATGGAA